MQQHRQLEVGIHGGVPMTWEVLADGYHPAALEAAHVGASQAGYQLGVVAVGAAADHGISRIVVDIENRCQVHIEAHRAELLSVAKPSLTCLRERRPLVSELAVRAQVRDVADALYLSPFMVHGDQEREETILFRKGAKVGIEAARCRLSTRVVNEDNPSRAEFLEDRPGRLRCTAGPAEH